MRAAGLYQLCNERVTVAFGERHVLPLNLGDAQIRPQYGESGKMTSLEHNRNRLDDQENGTGSSRDFRFTIFFPWQLLLIHQTVCILCIEIKFSAKLSEQQV